MEVFAGLTDFLPWILRILFFLFILRLIVNAFRPTPSAQRQSRPAGGGTRTAVERQGGQLVRDPQCGTYVPMATSVHLASGPSGKDTLYFCSTACRDAYSQARSSVA